MSQPVWYLNVQQGPNAGNAYPLSSGTITIGRDSGNKIVIDDPQVSRNHARLTWQGNTYVLEDLGSVNGTWVNGARIASPVMVRPGDSIGVGQNVALNLSDRPLAASLAPYATAYPTQAGVAPSGQSGTRWAWIVVAVAASVLLVALAVLVVVLLPGRGGGSAALSLTETAQAAARLVITATPSPTHTPSPTEPPTYTPYPTYTPVPTDPPTYTPYPTYTPVPTDPPTYTPYPTYTPPPTAPPTYTPYPTYTPQPTARPAAARANPTSTPEPTKKPPPPPFDIAINKTVLEPWGRPRDPGGCKGPYNDKDPVRRFTIEVILTNNSNRYIPDHWHPTFYTAKGRVPPDCIWYYNNTAVEPDEVIYVTFATHVETDDWVQAMVFNELGHEVVTCFNAAAQVVACR